MDSHCKIRPISEQDSKRIWEIRNHPSSRKFSNSRRRIRFKDHSIWFRKKYFGGVSNRCFVLEYDSKVIGYCRFDYDDRNNSYLVSIAVDPNFQGKGFGHKLLKYSLKKLRTNENIIAEINKINISSIKLFEKVGFIFHKKEKNNFIYKYLHE